VEGVQEAYKAVQPLYRDAVQQLLPDVLAWRTISLSLWPLAFGL
jgi:hypothetical protein